jgi:hypothetical protein
MENLKKLNAVDDRLSLGGDCWDKLIWVWITTVKSEEIKRLPLIVKNYH